MNSLERAHKAAEDIRFSVDYAETVGILERAFADARKENVALALGWMHAEACQRPDDPRAWDVPELLERALKDLDRD